MQNRLQRVIDVNLNRTREALRVCEDVTRFILNDKDLTRGLKDSRHRVSRTAERLLKDPAKYRDTIGDIGRCASFDKRGAADLNSLFKKNMHRSQESLRVLEEFSRFHEKGTGSFYHRACSGNKSCLSPFRSFKAIRFKLYKIEKKALKRLQDLRNN